MKKHLNIHIYGKVQLVGYRFTAKMRADKLGVSGFVRNESDGSVYIEALGTLKITETGEVDADGGIGGKGIGNYGGGAGGGLPCDVSTATSLCAASASHLGLSILSAAMFSTLISSASLRGRVLTHCS